MARDLYLSIDVGTGSARAALLDRSGAILAVEAVEEEQLVPSFGWAEQRPDDWWTGVARATKSVLARIDNARDRIAAVCACGQMHGNVLVDERGELLLETAPLWNDKRSLDIVTAFERDNPPDSYLAESGNPPTPAWPGFKLVWLREHNPKAYAATRAVIMPKDYINLRLTGEVAMDTGDASCTFLMSPTTRAWSPAMVKKLGLDADKLPPIREPLDILGAVSAAAAAETGLREGTPVMVGGADYPVALLGSGTCREGLVSDVTGTSCILTLIAKRPLLDPEISNVATVEGNWGPFVLLETGGDGMRWARRAFHEKALSYAEISAKAAEAPAGSDGLFFLPYLTGERLGQHRNARAQFFGLGAAHGLAHLHRAVLEGVAFAAARHMRIMEEAAGTKVTRVIASGGGAKTSLWLEIKASIYGVPVVVPSEPECGLIGCAAIAATATGQFASIQDAVDAFVHYDTEVLPNPAWVERYAEMRPFFARLYRHSQALYDDLDRLTLGDPS